MKRFIATLLVSLPITLGINFANAFASPNNPSNGKASVVLSATNENGVPILKNDVTWRLLRKDGGQPNPTIDNRHTVSLNLEAGRYTAIASRKGITRSREFNVLANTQSHILVPVQ